MSLGGPFSQLLALPEGGGKPASQLLVGPAFLRNTLPGNAWRTAFGPYWVVAVGEWTRPEAGNCTVLPGRKHKAAACTLRC